MVSSQKTIREGDLIPDVAVAIVEQGRQRHTRTGTLAAGRTIVLFALPGAFTPTCSSQHLPRYEAITPSLRKHGVDAVICLSVNDPFVMAQWSRDQQVGEVMLVSDGNGEFTAAMGMLVDQADQLMGRRSRRYSMLVCQGRIAKMFIEPDEAGDPYGVSSAETMLHHLAPDESPPRRVAMISKPGCPHCAEARELLHQHGLRYIDIPLPDASRTQALQAITGDSKAPQVFIEGRLIGGTEQLKRYFQSGTQPAA